MKFELVLAAVFLFSTGILFGEHFGKTEMREQFARMTNINWHSFTAAHADCESHYKERCKLTNGFAPLSSFKD